MTNKICRVCLSMKKPLLELEKHLSDYLQEICEYASGSPNHLCCSECKDSIKNNLDFRNKCRNSNQILQDWECDKSQEKCSIESLHDLLKPFRNDESNDKYLKITKYEYSGDDSDHRTNSIIEYDEIKDEFKVEVSDDEVVLLNNDENAEESKEEDVEESNEEDVEERNDEDVEAPTVVRKNDGDESDNFEVGDETVSDEPELQHDDKVIVKKGIIDKENVKTDKSTMKAESKTIKKVPIKYKLRGEIAKRSEFTKFESIFDVEEFPTYADARKELIGRRDAEPYVSAQYRCELCYTVYKCDKLLQFHMRWHDPALESSHECDVCSMRFASPTTLRKHKSNCHRGKFACKMCPLVTYQRAAMNAHFQKHDGKIYTCELCSRLFNHISSYLTHKRTVHKTSHVCVTCARTFVSAFGLANHRMKMHSTESKVDSSSTVHCEPCGVTFASQQVYTVHVLNTDAHRDIASALEACCSVCGLRLDNPARLKEHKRLCHAYTPREPRKRIRTQKPTEKNSDVIECKLCGLTGGNRMWLYQHFRTAHPSERYEVTCDREFLCDQCGKGFYNKTLLKEHMYVHLGLKPFRCEKCPATFRAKQHLRFHEARHKPPSRECPQCGKKFTNSSNLCNHMRSHGARRFKCDACAKEFAQISSLREHIRGVHLQIRTPRTRARKHERRQTLYEQYKLE